MVINNINNNVYSAIKNMEMDQVPQISNRTLDIYAKYINNFPPQPKREDLRLQNQIKNLNNLSDAIERAKNSSTFHKIISLSLLAASVAILASAVILAIVVEPIFLFIMVAGVITTLLAHILDGFTFHHSASNFYALMPLCMLEGLYVFDAFTEVANLEKQINANIEHLNASIEFLRTLLQNKELIKESICNELQKIDLTDVEQNIGEKQINELQEALRQLDKAEALLNKLNQVQAV